MDTILTMTIEKAEKCLREMTGLNLTHRQIIRNILDQAAETAYQAGRMQTPDENYNQFIQNNSNHAKQQP